MHSDFPLVNDLIDKGRAVLRHLEDAMTPRDAMPPDTDPSVKTIDRAARVLRAVAGHADGAMLSAVATETGLGKGTVHRLLGALIDAGFLFQEIETRRYRLGAGLALLGSTAHTQGVASLARPFLQRLALETEDTIYASVREGATAVCVAREIGAFPIRTLSLEVGHLRPLGVGSGSLALLASLSDAEIDTCIQKNAVWLDKYPGHSRAELLVKVAETRKRGYSLVEGQILPGMNAIGVAVLDARGRPAAALSMAAIADRLSGAHLTRCARLLEKEAKTFAKALKVEEGGAK